MANQGSAAVPLASLLRTKQRRSSLDMDEATCSSDPHTVKTVGLNAGHFDRMHGTEFSSIFRDEHNSALMAAVLSDMMAKESFPIENIANGLRWLIENWTMKSAAGLFLTLSARWPIDRITCLVGLVSLDWPLVPHTSLFVATLLEHKTGEFKEAFVTSLTRAWPADTQAELRADLRKWRCMIPATEVDPTMAPPPTPPPRCRPDHGVQDAAPDSGAPSTSQGASQGAGHASAHKADDTESGDEIGSLRGFAQWRQQRQRPLDRLDREYPRTRTCPDDWLS